MLSTIVAALLASSAVGFVGDRLTLAWSFSPLLDNVAGYAVVSGPETCSTWTQATDVGNVTRYSFPAGAFDPSRPTCFAVQAYDSAGNRSDYSDPVLYIPPGYRPTACAQPLGRMAVGLFAGRVVGTTGSVGSRARLEFQAGSPGSPLLSLTVRVNGEAGHRGPRRGADVVPGGQAPGAGRGARHALGAVPHDAEAGGRELARALPALDRRRDDRRHADHGRPAVAAR
jgi:hypothetical protein